MPSPLLLILAQATAAAPPPSPPQRIVLAGECPRPLPGEAIVCGIPETPRLPLPGERDEPGIVRRHPGEASDGADPGGCAALQGGCQVGVDIFGLATAAVRLVGKAIDPNSCCDEPGQATNIGMLGRDAVRALRKKPDKSNRVAIDLDGPPPSLAGRLSP